LIVALVVPVVVVIEVVAPASFIVTLIVATVVVATAATATPSPEPAASEATTAATSFVVVVEATVTAAHRVTLLHVGGVLTLLLGVSFLNLGDAFLVDFEALDGPFGLKSGCQSIKLCHPILMLVLNVLSREVLAREPLLTQCTLVDLSHLDVKHFILKILFPHVDLVLLDNILDVHGTALEHVS